MVASMAVGRGYMLGADMNGVLFSFGNGSSVSSGNPPGYGTTTENNPGGNSAAQDFGQVVVTQLPPQSSGGNPVTIAQEGRLGTLTYSGLTAAIPNPPTYVSPDRPYEWGQTVYFAVFNFPYSALTNLSATPPEPPPTLNFQISVPGQSSRSFSAQAAAFQLTDASVPTDPITGDRLDGYVIFGLPLSAAGGNSIAPGQGTATVTITTSGTTNPPVTVNVTLPPGNGTSYTNFYVDNPISLIMDPAQAGTDFNHQIGYYTDPTNPQVQVNGNPSTVSLPNDNVTLLTAPEGLLNHGSSGSYVMGVVDRSALALLAPLGLPVRLQSADLTWQYNGLPTSPIINMMPTAFSGFEDYPIDSPNVSLDYPDIARDNVTVVSSSSGSSATPLVSDVNLTPPTNVIPTNLTARVLQPTDWNVTLNTPRFQPANGTTTVISDNTTSVPGGYKGLFTVYVDSTGQGVLSNSANGAQAYRTFALAAGVAPTFSLFTTTPTIDLGGLPSGAGKTSVSTFTPWDPNGLFYNMFQPFNASNGGNVNDVNVGVLTYQGALGGPYTDFGV